MVGKSASQPKSLNYGVPQGSVLGPVLFSTYICPLSDIAAQSELITHQYADDCELYVSFKPKLSSSVSATRVRVEECVSNISKWMVNNKLKLNDDKTELIIFTPPRLQQKAPLSSIKVGDVNAGSVVRDLGCNG